MNADEFGHKDFHLLGDSAAHPIEQRWRSLAALLVRAGMSSPRRHALPANAIAAHSGASNGRFD